MLLIKKKVGVRGAAPLQVTAGRVPPPSSTVIGLFVASLSFMFSLSYVNHPCVYVYIDRKVWSAGRESDSE